MIDPLPEGLPDSTLLAFLVTLAHDLTVVTREVWAQPGIPDAQRVREFKILNEAQHRVTGRTGAVQSGRDEWTEVDFVAWLNGVGAECPRLKSSVEALWQHALRCHGIKRAASIHRIQPAK